MLSLKCGKCNWVWCRTQKMAASLKPLFWSEIYLILYLFCRNKSKYVATDTQVTVSLSESFIFGQNTTFTWNCTNQIQDLEKREWMAESDRGMRLCLIKVAFRCIYLWCVVYSLNVTWWMMCMLSDEFDVVHHLMHFGHISDVTWGHTVLRVFQH